jgi:hypothetical protein
VRTDQKGKIDRLVQKARYIRYIVDGKRLSPLHTVLQRRNM